MNTRHPLIEQAMTAERERIAAIFEAVAPGPAGFEMAVRWVETGMPAEKARAITRQVGQYGGGKTDFETCMEAIGNPDLGAPPGEIESGDGVYASDDVGAIVNRIMNLKP